MERLTERHRKKSDGVYMKCSEECHKDICEGCNKLETIVQRLGAIENILGDEYDLEHLRKLVEADRDGRCLVSPAKIGDTVYHITTCKDFEQVLDGTRYGDGAEPGTATGMYCPCEIVESCPFPGYYDGSFDCEKYKTTPAIFVDDVIGIYVDCAQIIVIFGYSGSADFKDFGKTVFLTRDAAEAALKGGIKKGDSDGESNPSQR